ncbi:MAG: aspartate 1-decarboxylase [Bacteroidetes bacterium]|nr:aspartate 1-decarboxylase [Bacteroidota bacterium]
MHQYEQIQVYNINNGERFTTYAIRAEEGSGIVSVNGAAAHKASPGDRVIICAYVTIEQSEAPNFNPKLVYLDERNQPTETRQDIPVQVA